LSNVSNNNICLDNNDTDHYDDDDTHAGGAQAARARVTGVGGRTYDYLSERGLRDRFAASSTLFQASSARRAANVDRYCDMTTSLCSVNNDNNVAVGKWPTTDQKFTTHWDRDDACNYYNNSNNNNSISEDENWTIAGQIHGGSGSSNARASSRSQAQRSAADLRAISCLALEVDAFIDEFESDRQRPLVRLVSRVLTEYRFLLGLGDRGDGDMWPSAWRLSRSAAGRWLVDEVLRRALQSLSKCHHVRASKFCRRHSLTALGVALLDDGADDQLTSQLVHLLSIELEESVLQRAVFSVAQELVDMSSAQQHLQQSVRCFAYIRTIVVIIIIVVVVIIF